MTNHKWRRRVATRVPNMSAIAMKKTHIRKMLARLRLSCLTHHQRGQSNGSSGSGSDQDEFLTRGEFALDLAFAETANQMIACAHRQRHHGKGRVLARRRHKARSVHHEQIFHVVRLVERIEH